jgi:hypothetical protein
LWRGRTLEFPELQTCLSPDGSTGRVDTDAFHCGHINHEATVANSFAGDTVTSATNGDENVVVTGEADTGYDVGGTSAAGNDGRAAINHGIRNSATFVISRVAGTKGLPAERGSKMLNGGFRDHLDSSILMK